MGFIQMLLVNKELNGTVKGIHRKFHRLEDLINGYRGVNASNFDEVNTLISSISRDVIEMSQRINRLGYAEQVSLLFEWTDGRKYNWLMWNSYAMMCVNQAKIFVNEFKPGYYDYITLNVPPRAFSNVPLQIWSL